MKKIVCLSVVAAVVASCSAPQYTAHFHNARPEAVVAVEPANLQVQPEQVIASLSEAPVVVAPAPAAEVRKTYAQMNKSERHALRQHLKAEVKDYVKAKKEYAKSAQAAKAMDHDLKLAAIFGAVGLVGLLIGGDVFWLIGGIAMIIGVVFFVKWLVRQ
ncbi:MAG: hypothetical protein MUC38_01955 [Cyclobacteriaceae bacterium]|jgi:uncharacterized membrane protein|nr:hypothetical protein [Cyclobacteriaceae bacterium]